jgi:porphobilinogen synthase
VNDPSLPHRPRRLRATHALRNLVAETALTPSDFIVPYFVVPGRGEAQAIPSLPNVKRYSVDTLLGQLEHALSLGLKAAMLFGVVPPSAKDAEGSAASDPDGPVPQALREARRAFGNELVLMSDVCLCAYTDHGHCGLLTATPRGVVIDNDLSLSRLATMAKVHAEAGADIVSPSDMMDGRVAAIRRGLDEAGHASVGILSYAVKYASSFYGPFRDAAGSAPQGVSSRYNGMTPPSDRKSYQMDPRNRREARREIALDEAEGADLLLVKPALPYLDVLAEVRAASSLPIVAYQVSGEYAMLKAAAAAGVLDEPSAAIETLTAIRRAGADLIVSYYAVEALEKGWL